MRSRKLAFRCLSLTELFPLLLTLYIQRCCNAMRAFHGMQLVRPPRAGADRGQPPRAGADRGQLFSDFSFELYPKYGRASDSKGSPFSRVFAALKVMQ